MIQSWMGNAPRKYHSQESEIHLLDLFRFAFKLYKDSVKTKHEIKTAQIFYIKYKNSHKTIISSSDKCI